MSVHERAQAPLNQSRAVFPHVTTEEIGIEGFSQEVFTATLALIGGVIVIAALFSGLIERSGLPQVAVFLALGAMLGPVGLGLLDIELDSPIPRTVAPLSLVLVLFTDAVSLSMAEVRRHLLLAFLVLGPGTLLSAVLIALAAWWMLDVAPAGAAILGAALATTDPVLLRGLLRGRDLPQAVRQALRLESGLNDAVLLPVVLAAMLILSQGGALISCTGCAWGSICSCSVRVRGWPWRWSR